MNASEPLMTCRKRRSEVRTGTESLSRDECGRSLFRAARPPALRWHDSVAWRMRGTWEPSTTMATEKLQQKTCKSQSRKAASRDGIARSSNEASDKEVEPRGCVKGDWFDGSTDNGRNP